MRISEHPIIESYNKGRKVTFSFDGKELSGYEGESIAAGGGGAGCVMIVYGVPNVRTCVTPLEEGMQIQTQYGVEPKKED